MFVCTECGEVFDEPYYWKEGHGFDYGPFEQWSGCPYCGGSYAEAYKCDCCDEWITGCYVKLKNGERICEECYTTYDLGEEL